MSARPSVVLFIDDSWQSAKAQELFIENGVDFAIMPASGSRVPGVQIGTQYYWGLQELSSVAETLAKGRDNHRASGR